MQRREKQYGGKDQQEDWTCKENDSNTHFGAEDNYFMKTNEVVWIWRIVWGEIWVVSFGVDWVAFVRVVCVFFLIVPPLLPTAMNK